ncbi:hypothetical protein ACFO25_11580 [Paenactinomyces guangxiensis]|nr:hypothetical protein [Paenactinomyces guangxiensis]
MITQLHDSEENHRCEVCGAELKPKETNNQPESDMIREYLLKYYE